MFDAELARGLEEIDLDLVSNLLSLESSDGDSDSDEIDIIA